MTITNYEGNPIIPVGRINFEQFIAKHNRENNAHITEPKLPDGTVIHAKDGYSVYEHNHRLVKTFPDYPSAERCRREKPFRTIEVEMVKG